MSKSIRKLLTISVVALSMIFFASGCSKNEAKSVSSDSQVASSQVDKSSNNTNEANKESNTSNNKQSEQKSENYSLDLAKFFLQKQNTVIAYTGTFDYGHKLVLKNYNKTADVLTIGYKGEIDDLSGGESGVKEDFVFNVKYVIDKDSVREVYDKIVKHPQKPFAIDSIILKAPLKEGTTFTNEYVYKDKKYKGETKIDKITDDGKTKRVMTTTIIKGIEGFKDKQFKEVREYEVGKGLISTNFNTDVEGIDFSYKQFNVN